MIEIEIKILRKNDEKWQINSFLYLDKNSIYFINYYLRLFLK